MTTRWPRNQFVPGGGDAQVRFLCFLEAPIEGALDLGREGWAEGALPAGMGMAAVQRPLDPENERMIEGFLEWMGDHPSAVRLRGARWIVAIEGVVADPPDLGHLQAAWAAVRQVCRRGALGVWDIGASMWFTADEVLARPPDDSQLACAWGVNVQDAGALAYAHTLGMDKFGRRDILGFAAPEAVEEVAQLLGALGELQVAGVRLDAGDRLERDDLLLLLEGYAPGFNAPALDFGFPHQPLLLTLRRA